MSKAIKIFLVFIIILTISINTYAKYNYQYNLKAFSLTRDNSDIIYSISRTENETEYTNKDVMLTINLNKSVENVDGFEISNDGKTLTRLIEENEMNTIIVEDISGNKKEISYNINNIDKIPPEIIGVEDGETYNTNKEINYMDNVGIKDIFIDKYSNLSMRCYEDFYDTSFYKGIDVTSNSINVTISNHPKNTKYYLYYLNGVLKAKTTECQFKYTGLKSATNYDVKVEAVDSEGEVLESLSRNIKTKYFSNIETEKCEDTFIVTLYGIGSKVDSAYGVGFTNSNNQKYIPASINSDRSLTIKFSALDITEKLQNGYYYFHIHLFDNESNSVIEFVCCNVIFNQNYVESENTLNPYSLTSNGNYQLIVTDLAGNITEKNITISK